MIHPWIASGLKKTTSQSNIHEYQLKLVGFLFIVKSIFCEKSVVVKFVENQLSRKGKYAKFYRENYTVTSQPIMNNTQSLDSAIGRSYARNP